jgi:hypothetical protein
MTTQTLIYTGETGTAAYDGWAGFVIGRQYELVIEQDFDEVLVHLPHAPGQQARMSTENFRKWFRKA